MRDPREPIFSRRLRLYPIHLANLVSKISYAALALIAAIPGGYLSYLLVMTMLDNFGRMPGMFKILSCAILACSALMTVMPVGIMIFVHDEEKDAESEADEAEAADEVEEVDAVDEVEETEPAPTAAFADDVEVTDTDQVEHLPQDSAEVELDQSKSVEIETGDLPKGQDSEEFVFDEDMYMTDDEEVEEKKKKKEK